MAFSLALTVGGAISFLLNLLGFLPLLINRVEPVFGESLKDRLLSLVGQIPQPQVSAFLVSTLSAVPTTWMLGFLMWIIITLLIAGFISMVKGVKGFVIGGVVAVLLVLYATGQLQALIPLPSGP